jgi:protein ImuB
MYACLYAPGNLDVLIECAQYFSPHIEQTSDGNAGATVVFRTDGLDHLFGPPAQLAGAITNRVGMAANIAIATEPDTAIHAARGIPGVTVIPPGSEAKVLAPLPLSLLTGCSPESAQILNAWGIRTFGELAALPPLGIAARLGDEGIYLRELARGESSRQLRPIEEALQFEDTLELDYPVELLEPLAFLLARLLNDLCQRLASRALAANEIRLCLFLENRTTHEAVLKLPLPMRDPPAFLKLLQLELDARPPQSPVVKIRMALEPVKPRTQQQGLFLPTSPEPERLEITLSRLMNLLGADNVGSPRIRDTHRPDSFQVERFSTQSKSTEQPAPPAPLMLRRFRPLKHAQVILANQRPARVSGLQISGKVVACAGPWRTSGEWWMPEPWDRDEWDVALSDGALYRLHEDRRTGRWFLEGNYD